MEPGFRQLPATQLIQERLTIGGAQVFPGHVHRAGHQIQSDRAQAQQLLQRATLQGQLLDVGGLDYRDPSAQATTVHDRRLR